MTEQEQHEQQHEQASDDWLAGATISATTQQPTPVGQVEVSFAGLDLPSPEGAGDDGATAYA